MLCGHIVSGTIQKWDNILPDEAKEEIDDEYLKMLESLGEDEDCCYLIPVFKNSLERVGTCSFIMR